MSTPTTQEEIAVKVVNTSEKKVNSSDQTKGRKNQRRPRPYNNRKGQNSFSTPRHGGTEMGSSSYPKSINIAPDRPTFPIYTSNRGCIIVASLLHRTLAEKIRNFNITEAQMCYVTQLAWLNRIVQTNIAYGTGFYPGASELKQVANKLYFPSVIAEYIETFGNVEIAGGTNIIPYFPSYEQATHWDDPRAQAGVMPPLRLFYPCAHPIQGNWPINQQEILHYNAAISRATIKGTSLRVVDNESFVGKSHFCVTSDAHAAGVRIGRAPCVLSDPEAQLGASYEIRDWALRAHWPGQFNNIVYPTHSSNGFDPDMLLSHRIAQTMVDTSVNY